MKEKSHFFIKNLTCGTVVRYLEKFLYTPLPEGGGEHIKI
jgi:hypothetical protein